MDRVLTVHELAAELGTTPPRVYRAVQRGVVRPRDGGRRPLRFEADAAATLRAVWGWAPAHPPRRAGAGARPTREELRVLAAVWQHPLGLRSARAVARVAGVSPTTATQSLARLSRRGVVRRPSVRVTEGRVRDLAVWTIAWRSPSWHAVMDDVRRTVLPIPPEVRPGDRVPARLAHLFWDTDWRRLSIGENGPYIAERILRMNDLPALGWVARTMDSATLRRAASRRGLTVEQRRLALAIAGPF